MSDEKQQSDIDETDLDEFELSEQELSALEKHIFGLNKDLVPADKISAPKMPTSEMSTSQISTQSDEIVDNSNQEDQQTDPAEIKHGSDTEEALSLEYRLKQAIVAHQTGDLNEAEAQYRDILANAPMIPQAWANLGVILRRKKAIDAAIICFRRGLGLQPKDGRSWSNLGNALRDAGQYEEAKRAHIHALNLEPGKPEIHYNLGLVHRDLGHLDAAEDCFRRAALLGYDKPDLKWDHALLYMLQGDLEKGFIGLEARWKLAACHPHFPELPIWKGAPLVGQVLMVYAEHGTSDSIQFCRYLPLLKSMAGSVIFHCEPVVARLLAHSPQMKGIEIIPLGKELPEDIDAVIPLLSVPRVMQTTASNLPATVPYLSAPQDDVPAFQKANVPYFRVGLIWHGDVDHTSSYTKAMNLADMAQVLDLPGVQFFSFQMGKAKKQIEKRSFQALLKDLSPHMRDYADAASLLGQMDLVISVDSTMAHIAGAMDIPVWVLLPFAPEWRWQMVRGDSPWYPSMELIRQTSTGDWAEVMHRVRDRLIAVLHGD